MKLITFIIIGLYFFPCTATVQQKDVLIYNGESYYLQKEYLEEYFECYPEKKPKGNIVSSDLWRGYIAFFVVIDKQIYLVDLQIRVQDENPKLIYATKWKSVFKEFSPDVDEFLVDWIDDLILLPLGEPVDYKQGFGISFKEYKLLEVKHGELIGSKKFPLEFYKKIFNKCHLFLRKKDLIQLKEKL